jgi:hypothetical protein
LEQGNAEEWRDDKTKEEEIIEKKEVGADG